MQILLVTLRRSTRVAVARAAGLPLPGHGLQLHPRLNHRRLPLHCRMLGGGASRLLLFHKQLRILAEEVHVYLIFWLLELVWADIEQDLIVFDLLTDRIE